MKTHLEIGGSRRLMVEVRWLQEGHRLLDDACLVGNFKGAQRMNFSKCLCPDLHCYRKNQRGGPFWSYCYVARVDLFLFAASWLMSKPSS